jgi:hypothetical protein
MSHGFMRIFLLEVAAALVGSFIFWLIEPQLPVEWRLQNQRHNASTTKAVQRPPLLYPAHATHTHTPEELEAWHAKIRSDLKLSVIDHPFKWGLVVLYTLFSCMKGVQMMIAEAKKLAEDFHWLLALIAVPFMLAGCLFVSFIMPIKAVLLLWRELWTDLKSGDFTFPETRAGSWQLYEI